MKYHLFLFSYFLAHPNMLMCKQMILTVFVIALALGAETEFQRRIVKFRPAADSTLVLRTARISPAVFACLP